MAISDDKVRVTVTIPKKLREDIQALAEKDMRSFSQYLTVKMTDVVQKEMDPAGSSLKKTKKPRVSAPKQQNTQE